MTSYNLIITTTIVLVSTCCSRLASSTIAKEAD